MGRVNLGTARIVIIVALFAGGIAVLANGFGSSIAVTPQGGAVGSGSAGGSDSSSPTTSPSKPPKETPSPQVQGVLIAVLNGTFETGLAGEVQQLLEADGYVAAQDPDDAQSKPVAKTVVYFRGGADAAQNRSDAHYLADTYLDGARVALLGSDQGSIAKSAQLVIIVGVDYADAHSGA
jgi:hypothetical protein